ncbi:MAG TPA: TadE/TadG family type IV pilus assembly protein [Actinomycetota bacterium]|nr:TadE/TadG family type IV pilus assembly protein [Actinomycetota bacterium]
MQYRGANDGGQATLELLLVLPLLLFVLLGLIQFAIWYNAEQTTIAAAQEGAAQASTHGGEAAAAQQRAQLLMAGVSSMSTAPQITVAPAGAGQILVSVSAHLQSLIPGLGGFGLHASALARVEQLP